MTNHKNSFEDIKRLKKELAMLKQDRDLLKKATTDYFGIIIIRNEIRILLV